jgi:hypothetical protein
VAVLVRRWVRRYTAALPPAVAARRREEIEADLLDHIAHGRSAGQADQAVALSIASRMVRGIAADVAWRRAHVDRTLDRATGGPMIWNQRSYRSGFVLAVATAVFLVWGVLAMGIVGAEGDPLDRLYLAVLGLGVVGAALVRLDPRGMVRVLVGMAIAQMLVALLALLAGRHESPVSSVAEILGLNGFFAALFVGAALLFHRAAGRPSTSDGVDR